MQELVRDHAWYCDADATGRRVILYPEGEIWRAVPPQPGRIETEIGDVPFCPGGNALFVRLGPIGHFAAAGHRDDHAWEWDGWIYQWVDRGPRFGNRSVIYDRAGSLIINAGQHPPTGLRFVDVANRTWTADETMADPANKIWEWTRLTAPDGSDPLIIGQGGEGPHGEDSLVAIYRGIRRRLCDGCCRFINGDRQDSRISIAWVQEDTHQAKIRFLTLDELAQFAEDQSYDPPPPEPKPSIAVQFAPSSGPIPLKVNGKVITQYATTWRWLLDGAIHQPIDGFTHAYLIGDVGDHALAVRAMGPGGTIQTDPVIVTATPGLPPPILMGRNGLQTGFREPIGRAAYAEVRGWGWDLAGLDCQYLSAAQIALCVEEARAEGLRPYAIIAGPQHRDCPDSMDLEIYADEPDPTPKGKEPDLRGLDPQKIAAAINGLMPYARAHAQTIWAGGASNTSPEALNWTERLVALLDSDVCVSFHRFPPKLQSAWSDPRPGFVSRRAEVLRIKQIAGTRRWGISSGGWCNGTYKVWSFRFYPPFLFRETRVVTQAIQAANERTERTWWRQQGAEFYIRYQRCDGPEQVDGGPGIYDYRHRPKAAAQIV